MAYQNNSLVDLNDDAAVETIASEIASLAPNTKKRVFEKFALCVFH